MVELGEDMSQRVPSVLEILKLSSEFLAKRDVDSPRLQAELMLAQILQMPRLKLYLNFETFLTSIQVDQMRDWVRRRGQHEPLQHLLGTTSFCGLEIKTTRSALIPRPETELLAERAWNWLRNRPAPRFLDFGTGTGCVALALLKNAPESRGVALDISSSALSLAHENAALHQLMDRIEFRAGSGFDAMESDQKFDLIISNPPYIPTAEIATLASEVKDHDPKNALDGGVDGLDFYRILAAKAGDYLLQDGRLMVEFGDGQAPLLRGIFIDHNWVVESVESDYSHRERMLVATHGGCRSTPCT